MTSGDHVMPLATPPSANATALLRRWLRARPEPDAIAIGRDVAAIGQIAVERSVAEIARSASRDGSGESAALRAIEAIVAALDLPPPRGWLGRRAGAAAPPPELTSVAVLIEAERDAALRTILTLETGRARLVAAAAALDEAAALVQALEEILPAAAREIAEDRPAIAALLRGTAPDQLQERRRDLAMQQLVLGQAIATNDLVAAGRQTLVETLERARTLTMGALRTAITVRSVTVPSDKATSADGAESPDAERDPLARAVARLDATIARRVTG